MPVKHQIRTRQACSLLCWLSLSILVSRAQKCKFPDYLQSETKEPWLVRDTELLHLYVDGGTITAKTHYVEYNLYTRTCAEKLDNDKYLVLHTNRAHASSYLCIQFHVRSISVVQVSSSNSSTYKRRYMCDDARLMLDHRPMLSVKHMNSHSIQCPFRGGFDMTVNNPDRSLKCNHRLMPLRLESECEAGEGMTFKFRYADCVDSDWGINYNEQKVSCIASWTHEIKSWVTTKYTFIALRQTGTYSEIWCMRIPESADVDINFEVYLFTIFVCNPEEEIKDTDNHVIIDLKRRFFNHPCGDINEHCESNYPDICQRDEAANCPKTCGICKPEVPIKKCEFSDRARGKWLLRSANEERNITIGRTTMNVERYGNFTCQRVPAAEFPDRDVLIQQFNNGCHPRYLCVDISSVPRSNSVLRYRLGNPANWPLFHKEHLKQYVCSNSRFEGGPMTNRKLSMVLIKARKVHFTRCRLQAFSSGVVGLISSTFCRGCLVHNKRHRSKSIEVTYVNCTESGLPDTRLYQCISRLNINLKFHALITKSKTDPHIFLCWVFPEKGRMFAVMPADCNADVITRVRFGDITPIYDWEINDNPDYCDLPHTRPTTVNQDIYTVHSGITYKPNIVTKPRSEKNVATDNSPNNTRPLYLPEFQIIFLLLLLLKSI